MIGLFLSLLNNGIELQMIHKLNFNSEIYIFGYENVSALFLS